MLGDVLKSLIGPGLGHSRDRDQPNHQDRHQCDVPLDSNVKTYGPALIPSPGTHDYQAAAQVMIEGGKRKDRELGGRVGDYYESKARKNADRLYSGMIARGDGKAVQGPSPAEIIIEEGRRKDEEYRGRYGNYYEKRAKKKAARLYGA